MRHTRVALCRREVIGGGKDVSHLLPQITDFLFPFQRRRRDVLTEVGRGGDSCSSKEMSRIEVLRDSAFMDEEDRPIRLIEL